MTRAVLRSASAMRAALLRIVLLPTLLATAALSVAAPLVSQSFNVDIGMSGNGPPSSYTAAGRAGVWNVTEAAHGTTSSGLVDLHGAYIPVTLRQIGGLDLIEGDDPATVGADGLLLDDFLVTYDAGLESCVFLAEVEPGEYEVLIYARMPETDVDSYTDVDEEPGNPHSIVGGPWPGQHQELVSYSRHQATVGPSGQLNLHSGIVPAANPADGAALNGLQVLRVDVFADGFEVGGTGAWSSSR